MEDQNYGWFAFKKGKLSGKAWVVNGIYSRFAFKTDIPEMQELLDAVTASTYNTCDAAFPTGYIYGMGVAAAKAQGFMILSENPLNPGNESERIY